MVRRSRAASFVLFVLPLTTAAVIGPAAGLASASSGGLGGSGGSGGSGGDSIASVQATIASQESKVTAEAAHIHKLTVAYNQDQARSQNLSQQIAGDRRSVRGLKAQVATSKADLRNAAVQAYTQGVSTAPMVPNSNPAIGTEYLSVASGDVSDTVDLLDTQRKQLGSDQSRLSQELAANKVAVAGAAKARKQALADAASTQAQIDRLQTHLANLKAQAAAAAAAAENAKQEAAAKAEEAKIAAEQQATQGGPVGDGLVTSTQGQVGDGSGPGSSPGGSGSSPGDSGSSPGDSSPGGSSPGDSSTTGEPPTVDTTVPETAPATTPDASPTETPTTVPEESLGTTPPSTEPGTEPGPTTPLVTVPPTTTPPTTAPAPPAASPAGGSLATDLAELRMCESSDNYAADTGNGFYGAYQFTQSTWSGLGYPGRPDLEPPAMQDQAAAQLAETVGWSQWPACSASLGLSGVA